VASAEIEGDVGDELELRNEEDGNEIVVVLAGCASYRSVTDCDYNNLTEDDDDLEQDLLNQPRISSKNTVGSMKSITLLFADAVEPAQIKFVTISFLCLLLLVVTTTGHSR
jgi:hypothetical protein